MVKCQVAGLLVKQVRRMVRGTDPAPLQRKQPAMSRIPTLATIAAAAHAGER